MITGTVERIAPAYSDVARIEPFEGETERIDLARIEREYPWAIPWAFDLEVLRGNTPNNKLEAPNYNPLFWYRSSEINPRYKDGFNVVTWNVHSPSQGIVVSELDLDRLKTEDGLPVITRFDPKRRQKALAERAWFLGQWNNESRGEYLYRLEQELLEGRQNEASVLYPVRSHRAYDDYKPKIDFKKLNLFQTLFDRKSRDRGEVWPKTPAFSDFNYTKLFDSDEHSRNKILNRGIFTRLGKHIRSVIALGPMYDVSGGIDAIVTAVMSGMLATIPRNGIFADPERQLELAREVIRKLDNMLPPPHEYGQFLKESWKRNVSVALNCDDPQAVVELAQKYVDIGITHFKVFTISSNVKIVETCKALRQRFGDKIELFAGQVVDKTEALQLIGEDIRVDGLCLGHGGGRQCTSAIGGMAITTIQLLGNLRSDKRFQNTTIMVEGGVGDNPGVALLMGTDGIYYFQRVMGTVIESPNGDCLLTEKATRKIGCTYRGEASVPTAVIESALSPELAKKHFSPAATSKQTEGRWGFTRFHRKASSGTHKIYLHLRPIAKMLADLGVSSIGEMRRMLADKRTELLTSPTVGTDEIAIAYGVTQ